jgi:hypothetical protein
MGFKLWLGLCDQLFFVCSALATYLWLFRLGYSWLSAGTGFLSLPLLLFSRSVLFLVFRYSANLGADSCYSLPFALYVPVSSSFGGLGSSTLFMINLSVESISAGVDGGATPTFSNSLAISGE